MASDGDVLAQIAKHVAHLQRRVQMIESLTRPQFKEQVAAIFTTDLSVAVVLWLEKSDTQKGLAKLVTKSIGRSLSQRTMSRELRRLKSHGVLGQTKSKTFFIEEAWREAGLETLLRHKAKTMGLKVARRRKTSR
jgi:hypothetical protein